MNPEADRAWARCDALEAEIVRLREALDALLEVAYDVVSDCAGTINPGFLELARQAIMRGEHARARVV